MKCAFCKRKAEYFIPPGKRGDKIIYVCEEHARKILLEGKRDFLPRIGLEAKYTK